MPRAEVDNLPRSGRELEAAEQLERVIEPLDMHAQIVSDLW
jgi:hypothetical protein